MGDDRSLLRVRAPHEHSRVTYVELFFDLVFVFAITRLSHALLAHFTLEGALQTLLLGMAVWWIWIFTTWFTNWLDPDKVPVRLVLFAMMLSCLLMSSSIDEAFGSRGLYFAAAYSLTQIGRTMFIVWALDDHNAALRRNFQRIVAWMIVAGVFWLAGALLDGTTRFGLWTLALGIEYAGPAAGFWTPWWGRSATNEWTVEGGHLAERCSLFVIIALGESILVTGGAFSGLEWTLPTVAAFVAAVVGSIALWWLYFDTTAEAGSHVISDSDDPGRIGRFVYTYVHVFIVAGIIVTAVADELVLAHPTGPTEQPVALAILGGPALYLVGTTLFEWTIKRTVSRSHTAGLAALLALGWAATLLSPLALLASTTSVLVVVAVWDGRVRRMRVPQLVRG